MSFSASGGTLTKPNNNTLSQRPEAIVVDEANNMLYYSGSNTYLYRLSLSSATNSSVQLGNYAGYGIYGITIYDGYLYISNYSDGKVTRILLSTAQTYSSAGNISLIEYSNVGGGPQAICFDSRGYLYVASYNNKSIYIVNIGGGGIWKTISLGWDVATWSCSINFNPSPVDSKYWLWASSDSGTLLSRIDVTTLTSSSTHTVTNTNTKRGAGNNGTQISVNSLGRVFYAVPTKYTILTDTVTPETPTLIDYDFIGVTGRTTINGNAAPSPALTNTNDQPYSLYCDNTSNNLYIACTITNNFYKYTFPQPTIGSLILSQAFVGTPLTITQPSSNSGGSFTYSSSNTAIATVSGNIITPVSVGTCVITARQNGYNNYSVGTVTATLTVNEGSPPPVNNDISKITLYSISSFSFI